MKIVITNINGSEDIVVEDIKQFVCVLLDSNESPKSIAIQTDLPFLAYSALTLQNNFLKEQKEDTNE